MAVTEQIEGVSFSLLAADPTPAATLEEGVSYDYLGVDAKTVNEVPEDTAYNLAPVDSLTTKNLLESTRYVITSISQASQQYVVNKTWDTVAGAWVRWETESIDLGGDEYPGPGIFGVHTSDYRVETVKYTRS